MFSHYDQSFRDAFTRTSKFTPPPSCEVEEFQLFPSVRSPDVNLQECDVKVISVVTTESRYRFANCKELFEPRKTVTTKLDQTISDVPPSTDPQGTWHQPFERLRVARYINFDKPEKFHQHVGSIHEVLLRSQVGNDETHAPYIEPHR